MGWWGKPYDVCPQGKERIAAVIRDEGFISENDTHKWDVLASALHGTTVYLICRRTEKATGKEDIWAEVCLTSWDKKGYFMIKTMSEDMGPYQYDCPAYMLKMLPPTENKYAQEWRKGCEERLRANRLRGKSGLKSLPMNTQIRLKAEKYKDRIITVGTYRGKRAYIDWANYVRFTGAMIERLGWEVMKA